MARQAIEISSVALLICAGSWIATWSHLGLKSHNTARPASPLRSDGGLKIQTPDGTVELAGVSLNWYPVMGPAWWNADGSTLSKRTWTPDRDYIPHNRYEVQQRQFAIHVSGQEHHPRILAFQFDDSLDRTVTFDIQPTNSLEGEWLGLTATLPLDKSTVTLRILVACGMFRAPVQPPTRSNGQANSGEFDDATFHCSELVDRDGGAATRFTLTKKHPIGPIYEYRLLAKDIRGQSHLSVVNNSPEQATVPAVQELHLFPRISATEIMELTVERRPGYCVEFQNVALFPGQATMPLVAIVAWPDRDE